MKKLIFKLAIIGLGAALVTLGTKTPVLSSAVWTNTGTSSESGATRVTPQRSLPATSDEAAFIALEKEIHQQINQYRQSRNLSPLEWDDEISKHAREHSQKMANGDVPFSHEGFEQRMKAIGDKLSARKGSENVATNRGHRDPLSVAVQGWIDSPGHRENIEGDYNTTGIGIARNSAGGYYFTQIFILKR